MKKITRFNILNVRMQGFKRFKEPYEAEFDNVTYITGSNGQGKSTIADAIAFAFCGTPFWGEKSCERLQNPECRQIMILPPSSEQIELFCLPGHLNSV